MKKKEGISMKCDGCGEECKEDEKLLYVFGHFHWCEKCIEDLNSHLTKK